MNIATALNQRFLPYTTVMLYSLAKNNPGHTDVYLLHSGLNEADVDRMRDVISPFDMALLPLFVDIDHLKARLPWNDQWTYEAYYRLLLAELLPDDIDRILYLDGDLIINKEIDSLYQMDLTGFDLIAGCDAGKVWQRENLQPKQQEMLGGRIDNGYIYFNSGVLLMNMARLRENFPFSKYVEAFEAWDYQMTAPDQDILNYVHGDSVNYFDADIYNMFARVAHNRGLAYAEVKEKCAVVHFAGDKPWESENVHYDIEQLWWDYAKETPFYPMLLEDFLQSSLTNTVVEDTIIGLQKDNIALKDALLQLNNKVKELFGQGL